MIRRRHADAEAFEATWSGRAPGDGEIAELVACAEELCAAAVEPSTQFRVALRHQLMTEAETALVPASVSTSSGSTVREVRPDVRRPTPARPSGHPVRRRLAGLTAALVSTVGVVGLVGSSAQAVPGDMLYPVKRGVENVELALHRDDASRGEFRLGLASERLAEARRVADDDTPQTETHVRDALDDFAAQASSGSDALFDDFGQSRSESSITTVNDFTAAAATSLAELAGTLPDGADGSFAQATDMVNTMATRAAALCGSCASANLSDIVNSVSALDGSTVAPPTTRSSNESDRTQDGTQPQQPKAPAATTAPQSAGPTQKPTVKTPIPTPTKAPSTLNKLTDPLVGALLGDDEQTGLVPGLLNTLLGGSKK